MASSRGCLRNMERNKPYLAMVFLQFVSAGMALLSKASITRGMNPYVFVFYRQVFASLSLIPTALYLERKSPPLSPALLCKILVSSTGITVTLNLTYFAFNYVSATFVTALVNTIPVIAFVLAVCFRMESLNLKQRHGKVKVIGSALGLLGALLCTFARGPPMYPESRRAFLHLAKQTYTRDGWIKGSLIVLAGNVVWCLWLIMQPSLIAQYPAKFRLTALQCVFSCATSATWAVAMERNPKSWKLGWNVNLISVSYCGVISAGYGYWLLSWVVEKKGPVFSAVFLPLSLAITAAFSAVLFQETLHWGSFCGAVLLVFGLFGVLWAKSKEEKQPETTQHNEGGVEGHKAQNEGTDLENNVTCQR